MNVTPDLLSAELFNMEKVSEERLAAFSLFSNLNKSQLERIATLVRLRKASAGQIIVSEGEIGGEMFLLLSGEIVISKRLTLYDHDKKDDKEKSLVTLRDKDNVFFGEMSLFESVERSATVTAVSDVVCGTLTREQLHLLCEQDPEVGYRIYFNIGKTLSTNLRRANRDILKLTTAFCLALDR